jgi:hypothetical protein
MQLYSLNYKIKNFCPPFTDALTGLFEGANFMLNKACTKMFQNPFTLYTCCKQKVWSNKNTKDRRYFFSNNNRNAGVGIFIFCLIK